MPPPLIQCVINQEMNHIKELKSSIFRILSVGALLLILIGIIDYIGVNVINRNGLVFTLHCYSYGTSFWIATLCFAAILCKAKYFSNPLIIITVALISGGLWWGITFCFLMMGFHSTIGGTY